MSQLPISYKNIVVTHNRGFYRVNDLYNRRIKYVYALELTKFHSHQAFLLRSFLEYKIVFKIRIKVDSQDDTNMISKILKRFAKFLRIVKIQQHPSVQIKANFLTRVAIFSSNSCMKINNIKAYKTLKEVIDMNSDYLSREFNLVSLFNNSLKFAFDSFSLKIPSLNTQNLIPLLASGEKHLKFIKSLCLHLRNKDSIEFDKFFHTKWSEKVISFSLETNFDNLFRYILPNIGSLSQLKALALFVDREFSVSYVEENLCQFDVLKNLENLETFKLSTYMQNCYSYLFWETFDFLYNNTHATELIFRFSIMKNLVDNPRLPNLKLSKTPHRKKSLTKLDLTLLNIDSENLKNWGKNLKEKLNHILLEELHFRLSGKEYSHTPNDTLEPESGFFDICLAKKLKMNTSKIENLTYAIKQSASLSYDLEEISIDVTKLTNTIQLFNGLPWSTLKLLFVRVLEPLTIQTVFSLLGKLKYGVSLQHVFIDLNLIGVIDTSELLKIIDFILEIKSCCREFLIIIGLNEPPHLKYEIIHKLRGLRDHFSRQTSLWRLDIRIGEFLLQKYDPYATVKLIMDEIEGFV